MRMGSVPGREGILRFATSIPQLCHQQTASFPTPPPPPAMTVCAPPSRRRNILGPCSASALAASLARLGGLSYLNLGVAGRRTASRYYFDYFDY